MTDIGKRLRELREERSITREGLARVLGVAPNTIYRYEAGDRIPNAVTIEELASALGISPGALFESPLAGAR